MRILLPFIGLILFSTTASAQFAGPFPIPAEGDAALFAHYSGYMQMRTTERGMPLNVNEILIDRDRTLWLGMEDGLLRCDGDRHTLYQHARADSTSVPNNSITDVRQGPDGSIWVGTQSGMARLNPATGRFKRFRIESDTLNRVLANRFWQVAPMPDGSAIALTEAGVFLLDLKGRFVALQEPQHYTPGAETQKLLLQDRRSDAVLIPTDRGILRISAAGRAEPVLLAEEFPGGDAGEIVGLTWTADSSLAWLDNRSRAFFEVDLRNRTWWRMEDDTLLPDLESLRGLHKGPHGEWWAWSWSGHLRVASPDGASVARLFIDRSTALGPPATLVTRHATVDDEGRLWFATSHGLLAFLPIDPRISALAPVTLSPASQIYSAMVGEDGSIAIGSYRDGLHAKSSYADGWNRLYQAAPARGKQHIEAENTITDIEAIGQGRYLVSTYHGIHEANMAANRMVPRADIAALHPLLGRAHFMALEPDTGGWWWAASWRRGLFHFNIELGRCEHYQHDPSDAGSLPIDQLLCLLIDRDGRLWIGCNNGGGLCRYRRETNDFERVALNPGDALGEAFGVVRALAQGPDGAIWVGTHKGGVARYDPVSKRTEVFDRERGVPSDLVRAILAHERLGIWIGGPGGIARWNPSDRVFQQFDAGLQWSEELNGIIADGARDALLVLNGKQVVRINALEEAPPKPLTLPRLVGIVVNGRQSPMRAGLRLTEAKDRLTVEFALNDVIRAQRTRVAWRLTGHDSTWYDCVGCRSATFNDLPSGAFRFEARTLGADGAWSPPVLLAEFSVHPPWWATWWFRALSMVTITLSLYGGVRRYLQAKLRQQREAFEREQAVLRERERIAGDMHDDLGAGLSALKLRSEMALRVEKDPAKREQLSALAKTAGELIGSMRQIIWTMNGDQSSLEDLVVYTTSYARNYCEQNALVIEVKAEGPWPAIQLSTEQRRNVFLVVKEALHNVVKHAHASTVRVEMAWRDGLTVEVADNGVGLSRGPEGGQGNGLRNMEKRIKALGGSLALSGGSAEGTRVRIEVNFAPTPNQGSIAAAQRA